MKMPQNSVHNFISEFIVKMQRYKSNEAGETFRNIYHNQEL